MCAVRGHHLISYLFRLGEAQQQIAIVFVLFFAGGQLGKGVQNADDFGLDLKRFFGVVWAGDGGWGF